MKKRTSVAALWIGAIVVLVGVGALAYAADAPKAVYPLDTCPVSGKKLDVHGSETAFEYKGREIHTCCGVCKAKLEANPDEYLKKLDAAIVEKQGPAYPLDTCVVSGQKFDDKMKRVDYVYKNRLVRFCCAACIATFEKDPQKYLSKLDAAAAAKKK
jgi:YHS domain-containing protein